MTKLSLRQKESILDKLGVEQTSNGGRHDGLYFLLDMHDEYQSSYVISNNIMAFPVEDQARQPVPVNMVDIYQGILEYVSRNRYLMAPDDFSGLVPVLENISKQMQSVAHIGQRQAFKEIAQYYERGLSNHTHNLLNPIRQSLSDTVDYFERNRLIDGLLLERRLTRADLATNTSAQSAIYA